MTMPLTGAGPSGSGGVLPIVTTNLVARWKISQGIFTDTSATTPATADGDNIRCWTDTIGGFRMRNPFGGNNCTLQKNGLRSGVDSMNLSNGILISSDAIGSIASNNFTMFFVLKRQTYDRQGLCAFLGTLDSSGSQALTVQDGFCRTGYGVDTRGRCETGFPISTAASVLITATPDGMVQYCINGQLTRAQASSMGGTTYPGVSVGYSQVFSSMALTDYGVYSSALSTSDMVKTGLALNSQYGFASQPARQCNLIYSGNSITTGFDSSGKSFAETATLGAGVSAYDYRNFGYAGGTIRDLINRDTTLDPATLYDHSLPANRNIVVLSEITNAALGGATGASMLSDLAEWKTLWKSAGFKVIGTSCPDQAGAGPRVQIAIVNPAMTTNAGHAYGDFICDIGANANLGTPGAAAGLYFDGSVHPSQLGHDEWGGVLAPQIVSAMA